MSVPEYLVCGIEGHSFSAVIDASALPDLVPDYDEQNIHTVQDLADSLVIAHATFCPCGKKLGPTIWHVNIPYGQDANAGLAWYKADDAQLLDGHERLDAVFATTAVPPYTIHLMTRTLEPLDCLFWELRMGLRRLGGNLCRVRVYGRLLGLQFDILLSELANKGAQSLCDAEFEKLSLWSPNNRLDTLAFQAVFSADSLKHLILSLYSRQPGVSISKWMAQSGMTKKLDHCYYYGGFDPHCPRLRFPILRRGPGFGKSTFLSAFGSYFDVAFKPEVFPNRLDFRLTPRMLVFHLDFNQLRLHQNMSDADMREECTRVMRSAAELFCKKYALLFGVDAPSCSGEYPYLAVRAFAVARNRKIFLAIDNYTAPFLHLHIKLHYRDDNIIEFRRIENTIYTQMLAHIFVDVAVGFVPRGFITGLLQPGEEDGSPVPFADCDPVSTLTEDLTRSSTASTIVGFTRSDVTELVRSFLGVEESAIPRVVNDIIGQRNCDKDDDTKLFPPRSILEALREYQPML